MMAKTKYVYIVSNDYDYEGVYVVSVETSAKKAIVVAEENQAADYTTVMRYTIGSGSTESKIIAQWKCQHGSRKFKRLAL